MYIYFLIAIYYTKIKIYIVKRKDDITSHVSILKFMQIQFISFYIISFIFKASRRISQELASHQLRTTATRFSCRLHMSDTLGVCSSDFEVTR
jgi:hypothetical protein